MLLGSAIVAASATTAGAQDIDWQKVDEALGRKPPPYPAMSTAMDFPAPIST